MSQTLRKTIKVFSSGGAWSWERVFVADPALLSLAAGDGDITVRRAVDGLRVPAVVTQRNAAGIDLQALCPNTILGVAEDYHVYVTGEGATAPDSWPTFGARVNAPIATIDDPIAVYTGEDETGSTTTSAEMVHPYVCRVPEGSWARHLDGTLAGEVTHLIADTPYPGSNVSYENPVLFYSTDNCATRHRVPSADIPWPLDGAPEAGSNKDTSCFFLPGGDLIVTWSSNANAGYCRITGDHLTNATVVSKWFHSNSSLAVGGLSAFSRTFLPLSDDRVRVWFQSGLSDGAASIYYRDTTNFGDEADVVWSAEVRINSPGGEYNRGWWHGGVCHDGQGGPFPDGYYYMIWSEGATGQVATLGGVVSHARCWRSKSIDGPWEPGLDVLLEGGGAGALAEYGVYMPTLSFADSGETFAVCSMHGDLGYYVGRTTVDLSDSTVPTATAFNQGLGSSSAYAGSSPLRRGYDLQRSGLLDASGNAGHATLTGDPVVTPGIGVTLNGSDEYIEAGIDLISGLTFVDITLVATFPTSLPGSGPANLFGDNVGAPNYALLLRVDPSSGKVTDYYWHTGSSAQGNSNEVGPDLRGGTHVIRAIYNTATNQRRLYIDGAVVAAGSASGALRAASSRPFRIGADGSGGGHLAMDVHYFAVRTGAGPSYANFVAGAGWTDGRLDIAAVAPTVAASGGIGVDHLNRLLRARHLGSEQSADAAYDKLRRNLLTN